MSLEENTQSYWLVSRAYNDRTSVVKTVGQAITRCNNILNHSGPSRLITTRTINLLDTLIVHGNKANEKKGTTNGAA